MSRTRNIKPGFFKNEELAECEPLARLLYAGLWTEADREGRLEDRPKRIKAEILPYDNCDIDMLLGQLCAGGFILRYEVDGRRFIQITTWHKHQQPHVKEAESVIPAPVKYGASTVQAPDKNSTSTELAALDTSSLNLDTSSLNLGGGAKAPPPAKRGTKAPRQFEITPDMELWAANKAPLIDVEFETEQFLDYHRAKDTTNKDWVAAWRTWIGKAQQFAIERQGKQNGQHKNGQQAKPKRAIDESVDYFAGLYAEQDEAPQGSNRLGLHGPAHGPAQRPGA